MSATVTEAPKVEDTVTLEVDGQALTARKGAMLIDVTDAAGIYIPRFCYHKKLTVAANCRMCLVEVERAPKPQPACATPVMEGMKVFTKSPKAISGQQATMEFLLINHPLDCPICDQGGECELQDLALGYGSAVSQFTERKRVVRDKDIGPLVQTDMTRCIHCTRCVRFGEEVAGLRELGATGRGEHMEIGTYVAQAVTSELSGNVIDLCPVGALTSKPYRYSARAWELRQADGLSPHDCVGANLHLHAKGQTVKRVVPRENEAVNETWIADRDRFGYQGLSSPDRLLTPRIREHGAWRECSWETAFEAVEAGLRAAGGAIGALASPSSTVEEFYLLQHWMRGLGSGHIDHRLRQVDFAAEADEPLAPTLGATLAELETAEAIVLVGGYPRHEQPLVNHRIRKAALRGALVVCIDTADEEDNFDGVVRFAVPPSALATTLGALVKAVAETKGAPLDGLASFAAADPRIGPLAAQLAACTRLNILGGTRLQASANRSTLLGLLTRLAGVTGGHLGVLTEGANSAGAWLAGAVPRRLSGGRPAPVAGHGIAGMIEARLPAYVLLGVEPELDTLYGPGLAAALSGADCVVALTSWVTPLLERTAKVLLPIAAFAENEGTFVNVQGLWQSFAPAVKPPGEARPAWKVMRMAGARAGLAGFDAVTVADVTRAVKASLPAEPVAACYPLRVDTGSAATPAAGNALEVVRRMPLYRADALVRRASALQQMPQAGNERVRLHPETLGALGATAGAGLRLSAIDCEATAEAVADPRIPRGCVAFDDGTRLGAAIPAVATLSVRLEGGAA